MGPSILARNVMRSIDRALTDFRVLVLNGPRQSGKSTLLRLLAERGGTLVSLDDRPVLRAARTDPAGFVEGYGFPLLIDGVQRGGDPLILAIKAAVDRPGAAPGGFILAGSSRFLTVPTLSESLAGRVRIIDLWPLSQAETHGGPDRFIDLAFGSPADPRGFDAPPLSRREAFERVALGGFPSIRHITDPTSRMDWFDDYARTLLERDLVELQRIRHRSELPRLLQLLAARTAQELNMSNLAQALDANTETIRSHVALLETIYVHHVLPPWSANFTARAKHRPKLHFVDSGLAANLLGTSIDALAVPTSVHAGPLLETFVVGELMRQLTWSTVRTRAFDFRDRDGREVDVILEARDGRIVGVEVKAAKDVDEHDFRWLAYLRDRLGERFVAGFVVHLGERPTPFGDRLIAVPLSTLWSA